MIEISDKAKEIIQSGYGFRFNVKVTGKDGEETFHCRIIDAPVRLSYENSAKEYSRISLDCKYVKDNDSNEAHSRVINYAQITMHYNRDLKTCPETITFGIYNPDHKTFNRWYNIHNDNISIE